MEQDVSAYCKSLESTREAWLSPTSKGSHLCDQGVPRGSVASQGFDRGPKDYLFDHSPTLQSLSR